MNVLLREPEMRLALHTVKPSAWARDVLGFRADAKQREFLDGHALDTLLLWSRQTGKTESTSAWVSHRVIHNNNHLALICSATQRQAGIMQRRVTRDLRVATGDDGIGNRWKRGMTVDVEERQDDGSVRLIACSVLSLELSNGSQVVSVPAHPDTVRGYSPDSLAIDEAVRVGDDVFYALSPMRASKPVPMVALSTAGVMMGWFYKLWSGDDPDVVRIEYDSRQCPRMDPKFLETERRRLPPYIYEAEYENKWYPMAGGLFSQEDIEAMKLGTRKGVTVKAWNLPKIGEVGSDEWRKELTIKL